MKLSSLSRGPEAATIALLLPLAAIDRRLQATGGPGIIPFELAGPGGTEAILDRWGEEGRRWAIASLLLDFPFLVAYTRANLAIVERLGRRADYADDRILASLARPVGLLHIVAGASDAVENAALLAVVARRGDPVRAALARRAARTKFAALGAGWAYAAAVMGASRRRARRPRAQRLG